MCVHSVHGTAEFDIVSTVHPALYQRVCIFRLKFAVQLSVVRALELMVHGPKCIEVDGVK